MFAHGETWSHEAYNGTVVDDLGNDVPDWADAVSVPDCGFAPEGSTEPRGTQVITTPVLYVPRGVTVTPRDRFTGRGVTYQVIGEPGDWRHPMTGWLPDQLEVKLERVTGG